MFSKLQDRLFPEERIVFHSRYGVAANVFRTIAFVVVGVVLIMGIVAVLGGGVEEFGGDALVISVAGGFLFARMINHAVLVTDVRVLYRHGAVTRKIEDVRIGNLKKVKFFNGVFGFGSVLMIERVDGGLIEIRHVPRLDQVKNEIEVQIHLQSS